MVTFTEAHSGCSIALWNESRTANMREWITFPNQSRDKDYVVPFSFDIARWKAWAPGIADDAAWLTWAKAPGIPTASDCAPDVMFLPALQRRRLSRLARMSFAAAWPLLDRQQCLPVVFGSRHGDTPVTYSLLSALARGEALSPTQFGLSVHNAVAGQWSIQRPDASEMSAVAGDDDTLESTFLEAAGLLHDGHAGALVILAEDTPPDTYRDAIDDVPFPYAMAFHIVPGNQWSVSVGPHAPTAPVDVNTRPLGPALNMLAAFLREETTWTNRGKRTWTWQRQC